MRLTLLGNLAVVLLLAGCANSQRDKCGCCESGTWSLSNRTVVQASEIAMTYRSDGKVYQ